ncbi:MAG: hypothetical protein WCG67_03400 [Ferruginibacter sp.]
MLVIAFSVNAQFDKTLIAAKLKAMEVAWNNSILEKDHGMKTKSEILADDFYQINYKTGKMQNKTESLLFDEKSKEITTSVVNNTMTVHFYGTNVATAIGSHGTKGKANEGKVTSKQHFWVDTYLERNGKWQCISSGGTITND